jgi:hypothetical protein
VTVDLAFGTRVRFGSTLLPPPTFAEGPHDDLQHVPFERIVKNGEPPAHSGPVDLLGAAQADRPLMGSRDEPVVASTANRHAASHRVLATLHAGGVVTFLGWSAKIRPRRSKVARSMTGSRPGTPVFVSRTKGAGREDAADLRLSPVLPPSGGAAAVVLREYRVAPLRSRRHASLTTSTSSGFGTGLRSLMT